MRIILLAGVAAVSFASSVAVDASPKYTAPINVTTTTTIKLRAVATAPSPLSETLYQVAGDIDGDGIVETGTLRVACRGAELAFASISARDLLKLDAGTSEKIRDANVSLSRKGNTSIGASFGGTAVIVVERSPPGGKTMGADSWHTARISEGAARFCPR